MDITLDDNRTNSRIVAAYCERTKGSAWLAREAASLLPSGIAHDARNIDPYGPYIVRAKGPHKWDVDGNRYVDFFGGHGALILGHQHPAVTTAVTEAMQNGTHFGASHPGEVTLGQGDSAPGALGRTRPLHILGHRGDADGSAARPRLYRQKHASFASRAIFTAGTTT